MKPKVEWLLPELLQRYDISVYRMVQELEGKVGRSTLYKWSRAGGPVTVDPTVLGWVVWALRRLTGEHIVEGDILRAGVPGTERKASTMAHIIALANQKGGVAKTTTAIHLAAGLATRGHRVLAIDVDPQANLTAGLGVTVDRAKGSITNVMKLMNGTVEKVIHPTGVERLDLAPSDIDLAGVEVELVNRMARETVLRSAISPAVRSAYDFIILDSPPNLGMLTMNVLSAATAVVVPVGGDVFSIQGLNTLMAQIRLIREKLNPDLKLMRALVTRVANTNISVQVSDYLRQMAADGEAPEVFATEIKELVSVKEAAGRGMPVYMHEPKGKAAELYLRFTDEFLDQLVPA